MGQKVNPRSFRQTTTYTGPSRWFATRKDYIKNFKNDVEIRKLLRTRFRDGGIARIEIERSVAETIITVYTSKPGVVIGRGGSLIEETKKEIKRKFFGSEKMRVTVNIQEVRDPDLNAELIVQMIRDQLEARVPFRRAIKRAMEQVIRANAKGCRISVAGRLNGAEIARTETIVNGQLPLHTLRADIDYSRGIARTVYGVIGIKVWVYKGEVFGDMEDEQQKRPKRRPARKPRKKRIQTGGKKTILRKKQDIKEESGAVEPKAQAEKPEAKKPEAKKPEAKKAPAKKIIAEK
ncbi:MAG: 30S ribosomal protein S3 [Candidatus Kerfeldbacteria bacterium]